MPAARPVVHRPLAVGAHARGEEGRPLGNKIAVEFIGTFFLVFTVGAATAKAGAGVLAPLAIGAVLMAMVFAGGHVSGAHYNPAVTAAIMIRGKIKPGEALAYVTAQVTAAALAGVLARAIDGSTLAPAPAGIGKVLAVEFLFTFALAYVVLNVATSADTRDNSYYGLAIGFTVVAGALAVGGISRGAFNPAVVVGGSIIGLLQLGNFWIYLLAELAGGIAAAVVFLQLGGDAAESTRAHLAGDGA